ncbi:hypothetical protein GUITHDRAFT_64114 [Guillardia theta CCMP2712]|uniref:Major facilitator superfamily (MFS) profile domain-containing protein n=1 Tax=Guillardia theta (strain CCMP2712) TaxID=905079 RepID=L1JZ53_GUITC|nr:hypothetical protein GUITHDRAFT_64114 [Guillardia theta CCMP2712]EKX53604.1 hypothetical protein GUITHDRAFT_64114 [Guillardia theta CCMP2712]|eukprot:XP_005840584.1 hypothetical protein GUITHDRAFT_64114 [Guillardia theta CCMP2712]
MTGRNGGERDPLLQHGREASASKEEESFTYDVFLLCIITALLFADQNLMAPNLTQIARDFGFSDEERDTKLGGEIALGFFVLGGPVALAIGYLADMMPRKMLFVTVVFLGEIPCLLTIFVTEYWQLFILRAMTGIAIGGAPPLIFSLLGDMYGIKSRTHLSASIMAVAAVGVSLGQLVSGLVGPTYGWRTPFLIIAVPAILLNFLFWFTFVEPRRGYADLKQMGPSSEITEYEERISWGKAIGIFTVPTNIIIFLQGIPGCLPWAVTITFLNDYLAQEKKMTVEHSTIVVTCYNLGILGGVIFGGVVGQLIYNIKTSFIAILMGVTTFLGIFPLLWLIYLPVPTPPLLEIIAVALIGGLFTGVTGPCIRAVLLNVNMPETRGSAQALLTLTDDLGKGLGPLFMALLIIGLHGRLVAMSIAVFFGWLLCSILLCTLFFTIEADQVK